MFSEKVSWNNKKKHSYFDNLEAKPLSSYQNQIISRICYQGPRASIFNWFRMRKWWNLIKIGLGLRISLWNWLSKRNRQISCVSLLEPRTSSFDWLLIRAWSISHMGLKSPASNGSLIAAIIDFSAILQQIWTTKLKGPSYPIQWFNNNSIIFRR